MSSAQKLTKKQKKALAFRERKGKGKAKETEPDAEDNAVPVMEDQNIVELEVENPVVVCEEGVEKGKAGREQVVQGKKRRREADDGENAEGSGEKSKKKKRKREAKKDGNVEDGMEGEEAQMNTEGKKEKQQRFILFVGNLKYATTKQAVQKHFAACDPPPMVRLMTSKPSANSKQANKSKGFAFLEFTDKKGLQQALKLHHSQLEGRMINVELTAGGGGKSERRIAKLKERNKELFEQRRKRVEKQKGEDAESGFKDLVKSQRYSATSGVEQVPTAKRTWSVPDSKDEQPKKKRGSKKPPRSLGTGVNAIPVG